MVLIFFKELINRLRTKSPKFFLIIQIFAASLTFAGFIPYILKFWFNIEVPANIVTICKDVSKVSTGSLFIALMSSSKEVSGQTMEGRNVYVTDEKKLPFTAKIEEKAKPPEPPVLPDVPEPDEK